MVDHNLRLPQLAIAVDALAEHAEEVLIGVIDVQDMHLG